MSVNEGQFPNAVYDGLGPDRVDRERDAAPSHVDWDQMIAELIAVQQQQLDDREFTAINDEGSTLIVGSIVFMKTDGTVALADSDVAAAAALKIPVGLVKIGGIDGADVTVQFSGRLVLTLAEWDAVGLTSAGLIIGASYYLAGTPGELTATAPNTAGDTLFKIGVAISATTLLVRLDDEGLDIA